MKKHEEKRVKKSFLCLTVCVLLFAPVMAQNLHEKGTMVMQGSAGIGMVGIYGSASVPPLALSFDYGISKEVSVGIYAGYASSKETYIKAAPPILNEDAGIKYGYTIIGIRGSYHFDLNNPKIDAYGTVIYAYNIVSASIFGLGEGLPEAKGGFSNIGASLGIRYYISPNIALFGEGGYGVEYLRVGLAFKL